MLWCFGLVAAAALGVAMMVAVALALAYPNLPDSSDLAAHRQTRVFRDPDGLTSHAAMTFDAFVEVAA